MCTEASSSGMGSFLFLSITYTYYYIRVFPRFTLHFSRPTLYPTLMAYILLRNASSEGALKKLIGTLSEMINMIL